MPDSWSEERFRQYQRQRGALEEEQDRVLSEDRKRIEECDREAYDFGQWVERLHYSFERVASQSLAVEAARGHQTVQEASEEGRFRLRQASEAAARQLEDHRREYNAKLDSLERSYRRQNR